MMQDTRDTIGRVSGREGTILSAYVSVNPAVPENKGQAYKVRQRDGMNDEGVPQGVQDAVRERVEEERHSGARTLVVFASEDGMVEISRLQVDLPESSRWGEPYVAPLLLALDEHEPHGVALLDAERFRYSVSQEENRVYHLVALWDLGGTMRWCENDELVIRDPEAESCPFCGQPTRERPSLDVLGDLAAARGARLDFVHGENENAATLHEFSGLAGLTRF